MKNNIFIYLLALCYILPVIYFVAFAARLTHLSSETGKTTETTEFNPALKGLSTPKRVKPIPREDMPSLLKASFPHVEHSSVDAKEMQVIEHAIDPKNMEDTKELIADNVPEIPTTWLMPPEGLQPGFPVYVPPGDTMLVPVAVPEPSDLFFVALSILAIGALVTPFRK